MIVGKAKSNTIKVLVSQSLIDSVNYLLREYNEMKEEITNPETSVEYII